MGIRSSEPRCGQGDQRARASGIEKQRLHPIVTAFPEVPGARDGPSHAIASRALPRVHKGPPNPPPLPSLVSIYCSSPIECSSPNRARRQKGSRALLNPPYRLGMRIGVVSAVTLATIEKGSLMFKKLFFTAAAAAAVSVPLAGVAWATPSNNEPPGQRDTTSGQPGIPGVVGEVADGFNTNPYPGQTLPPGQIFSNLEDTYLGSNTPERYATAINGLIRYGP